MRPRIGRRRGSAFPVNPTIRTQAQWRDDSDALSAQIRSAPRLTVFDREGANGTLASWDYEVGMNHSVNKVSDRDHHGYLIEPIELGSLSQLVGYLGRFEPVSDTRARLRGKS